MLCEPGVKGQQWLVTRLDRLLQKLRTQMLRRSKLGREVMCRRAALTRQHKPCCDFNLRIMTDFRLDLFQLLAAIDNEALALVELVSSEISRRDLTGLW